MPKWLMILCAGLSVGLASAKADEAVQLRYKFSPGQVLRYSGKQSMTV